ARAPARAARRDLRGQRAPEAAGRDAPRTRRVVGALDAEPRAAGRAPAAVVPARRGERHPRAAGAVEPLALLRGLSQPSWPGPAARAPRSRRIATRSRRADFPVPSTATDPMRGK